MLLLCVFAVFIFAISIGLHWLINEERNRPLYGTNLANLAGLDAVLRTTERNTSESE
jgi:hypothetical protein